MLMRHVAFSHFRPQTPSSSAFSDQESARDVININEFMSAFTFAGLPQFALLMFQLRLRLRLININELGVSFRSWAPAVPVQACAELFVAVNSLILMSSCLKCGGDLININELKPKIKLSLKLINVNEFGLLFNFLSHPVQRVS